MSTALEYRGAGFSIVAVPRPFKLRTALVQDHAIRSWIALRPAPEVILCGSDLGTKEACARYGLKHAPEIVYNELGVPLMHSVLEQGERFSSTDSMLYTNADIVFTGELSVAVRRLRSARKPFVATGNRWNVSALEDIDYTDTEAVADLAAHVRRTGHLKRPWATDYFLFQKGFYADMPSFTVGRKYTDNWMIWYALSLNADVVDIISCATAIHERHDHSHVAIGDSTRYRGMGAPDGIEAARNLRLAGGINHVCNIMDATLRLTPDGMKRNVSVSLFARRWLYARSCRHYWRTLKRRVSHHWDMVMTFSASLRRGLWLYRWWRA